MTVAVHIRFSAGRYHGTSWGHHVNEGSVDWPPSPMRILRALHAQSFRSSTPIAEPDLVQRLFKKLSVAPAYGVPEYTVGHSRHYMPTNAVPIEKGRVQVLDAFVAVDPREPLTVQWEGVELDHDEEALLKHLVGSLTYLGRAESWCEAVVGEPVMDAVRPGEIHDVGEPVSLLALAAGNRDIIAALEARTDRLRKAGAQRPKDTRFVQYFVPPPARPLRTHRRREPRPTGVLFQIDAGARPRIVENVDVADRFRRALLSVRGRADGSAPVLAGKRDGTARTTGHKHAHYLPFDAEGDGAISHLLVWAEEGFDRSALDAMQTLRRVRRRESQEPLTTALVEVGPVSSFEGLPVVGRSRTWRSLTPFMLNRHPKRRGGQLVDGPVDQLRRELALRGLPELVAAHRLDRCQLSGGRSLRWLEFRRWRRHREPAIPEPFGYRIELASEISGPLCLGFGSHFGLGLFVPEP